ncbi:MAG: SAM-dependent methyltransferase [Xanthomonadales bacterium]|nr:SAM-dependent methyltransferase [Xanthomonadales bacterium]
MPALASPPGEYLILEPSAALRSVQHETLSELPGALRERVRWVDQPPDQAFDGVIIGNEVLDALPVARFRIGERGELTERGVELEESRFGWIDRPPRARVEEAVGNLRQELSGPLPGGYTSEIAIDMPGLIRTVTEPLSRGLVLFIDYGYPRQEYYHPDRSDGTLVCHYRHRAHFDPFVWPGLTDISAFVDFTAVAEAGDRAGLEVIGFTSQAGFLLALGAHEAVEQAQDDAQRLKLAGELKRLTLPGEMGEKFKVIGMTRGFDQPLSGFGLMSQLHRL